MLAEIKSGRRIFEDLRRNVYDLIEYLPSGLMLDVGAAAGLQTRTILSKSPNSHVLAFEPFSGNWEHFLSVISGTSSFFQGRAAKDWQNSVTLIKKAVTNHCNGVAFSVSSTVNSQTAKGPWAHFDGYSSLGKINLEGDCGIEVIPSTTLDYEVGDRSVIFAKIDVQGGEADVLRGAESMISEGRVLLWQTEFRGEPEILRILDSYINIDTEYMIVPRSESDDLSAWDLTGEKTLSTGKTVYTGWPKVHPNDYVTFFKEERSRLLNLETDIISVSPECPRIFLDKLGVH